MVFSMTPPDVAQHAVNKEFSEALSLVEQNVGQVIRGKEEAVRMCMVALLARGHILVEDIPGVGKTSLARAIARSVGGEFRRIQFTSDMLPSDIVGISVFKAGKQDFEFRPGPLFANVVLADEINRTTPRTQSALMEAMSEGKISVDDKTYDLPDPFLVIATQNPTEHFGTYPLPESQMDRFIIRIRMGYPSRTHERDILKNRRTQDPIAALNPVMSHDDLLALQAEVPNVRVEDAVLDYAMSIIEETRNHPRLDIGVSTRGALAWLRAAQAHAIVCGRDFTIPDDFKTLAIPALAHRVVLAANDSDSVREEAERTMVSIVEQIPVPT